MIQVNLPLYMGVSLWEALFVVSQRWVPFPTALYVYLLSYLVASFG